MLQNKLHAFVARLTVSLDLSLAMAVFLLLDQGSSYFSQWQMLVERE